MSGENRSIVRRWFHKRSVVLMAAGIGAIALSASITNSRAQGQPQDRKGALASFPDLVSGLKATPGCLGVETARTSSGKIVIFAWFEDKKAVLKWYYSDMHQQVMNTSFPNRPPREPLQGVPDDSGPILAIASITMSEKPQLKETSLPISQIPIELYQPVAGGLSLGGRFAPESVKVRNMRDYTPKGK